MAAAHPRALVVGGTSGIGQQATLQLAERGHQVVVVGRDARRGRETVQAVSRLGGAPPARFVAADVSTAAGIGEVADEVLRHWDGLDVLVNGAGVLLRKRCTTAEGFEVNFAVHHLAPFSLTSRMLPLLRRGGARVVNINSEGHRAPMMGSGRIEIDFTDLQSERGYQPFVAYSCTKLANLLFQLEAQRRHPELTLVALHPGMARSNIGRDFPRLQVAMFAAFSIPARRAARSVVTLATADRVTPGGYYDQEQPSRPSRAATDAGTARQLWEVTEQLRGPFDGSPA
jgi:NAD(P)-dependent dehydrogenase (short-subunit alcohol dehydrogenase family)